MHITGSQIGHYETGRSVPTDATADALDVLLSAGGDLKEAAIRARGDAVAPWLQPWADNESRAAILRWFEPSVIPGLLQTEAYARAVTAAGLHTLDQIEEAVSTRLRRQAAALDRPDPVTLTAIMDEAVLWHGHPGLMKSQLEHLLDVGLRPNVHVRVVPYAAGLHAGHAGPFVIATLPTGAPVTYVDGQLDGDVASRVGDLIRLSRRWESVCAMSLSCEQTRVLIQRVIRDHETDVA